MASEAGAVQLLDSQSCLSEAEEVYELMTELDSHTRLLGQFHPQTLAMVRRLAISFWRAGEVGHAIGLLDQALNDLTSSLGPGHPFRGDMLKTLANILYEECCLEPAAVVQRELTEWWILRGGANHPNSLEAKGSLAAILFELGQDQEAGRLEQDAFNSARTYLGQFHPVTCVLAWNLALRRGRRGDPDSQRRIVVNELVWLLAQDPSCLDTDQNAVRSMLTERLNWNVTKIC